MFNLNGIDPCIIVLIFAFNTCALHNSNDDNFNVGTVLFTANDLNKKRWSTTNIELLRARRYFQNIIPSPSVSLNEDYINNLLKYFTNAFTTLKRETIDPGIADVMEKALSDAVGGYLKVWVLPLTKLTYYGGAVSQDNAIKVFKFYEKLKRSLNTDGNGWRKPSQILLNSIEITVVPITHMPETRSMKYPCELLAYYEKSDTGLTIPTPYINWNDSSNSMFLPLKNESLIQLDSPSSSNALLKYYDIAESCCQSRNPDSCNEFDVRFHNWISNNVVPHINDDKLYIAFGSLLSLINKTNEFIQRSINMYEYDNDKFTLNSLLSKLPSCMTSKKFLILVLIFIIEIIWCIPAFIYIICWRRRSRMKQRTKFFLDTFRSHRCQTVGRIDKSEERNNVTNKKNRKNHTQTRIMDKGVKLVKKPRLENKEVDTQYPSNVFRRSAGQMTSIFSDIRNDQECQYESVTLINEKVTLDTTHSSYVQAPVISICKDIKNINQNESYTKIHKKETTITKIVRDKSRSNSKPFVQNCSTDKTIQNITSEIKRKPQELHGEDKVNDICPCCNCIDQDRRNMEVMRTARLKEPKAIKANNKSTNGAIKANNKSTNGAIKANNKSTNGTGPRNVTNTTRLPKLQPKVCAPRNVKLNQSKGLKLNTGEPLLEIRIDRPAAEITVDITKTCRRSTKPSKIPRLAPAVNANEKSPNITPRNIKPCVCIQDTYKTLKKRSMDDFGVNKKVVKHNKLNMTF